MSLIAEWMIPLVIRARAAGVLGHIGDARAADPLRAVLNDPDRHIRIRAGHALRQLAPLPEFSRCRINF